MSRRFITTGSKWEALAGYSRAVVDGRDIFVSGTIGADMKTGALAESAAAQTETAIDTIAWALAEAGASLVDIVRVRVFVPDRGDVEAISRVIARRIGPARAANTTICAALPVEAAKVEIEVTARLPSTASH
jgi:enamine deaminase RidA (YjgF/YER057c/UK114 family)